MPTQHLHRIILVVPAGAKATAVANWLNANVDANAVPTNLGPALEPAGGGAVSHRWCNGAWTDSEARQILARLCNLAGVSQPSAGTWGGWTGAKKRTWLAGVRASLLSSYGVYVMLAANDGVWDDPGAALAAMGLRVSTA